MVTAADHGAHGWDEHMSVEQPQPNSSQPLPKAPGDRAARRDVRRLAMQVLYQIDQRGAADQDLIHQGLADGPDNAATQAEAFDLAQAAWRNRAPADRLVTELAPQWPTHRQPPVDRALLRLAYHEMVSGRTPVKIAINEAVELAKHYGAENSPAFINGVLDKLARQLTAESAERQEPAD